MRASLAADLAAHGLAVEVQGRPKHLYSIWKKMRRKASASPRCSTSSPCASSCHDVAACYAVLGRVHERYRAIAGELDDYIARPKANGYRSLHTVVEGDDGGAVEIQIRTAEMHEHAEYGVSAHWAYKEADAANAAVSAGGAFEAKVAQARLVVLRQLLAWERDLASDDGAEEGAAAEVGRAAEAARARRLRRPHLRLHAAGRGRRAHRRARRRSTSPTPSTPTSAIAAAAPRSTARSCR